MAIIDLTDKDLTHINLRGSLWAFKNEWQEQHVVVFAEAPADNPDHLKAGYLPLGPFDIDAPLPHNFDLVKAELAALRIQRQYQLIANEAAIVKIDEEIQKRLALTDKTPQAQED